MPVTYTVAGHCNNYWLSKTKGAVFMYLSKIKLFCNISNIILNSVQVLGNIVLFILTKKVSFFKTSTGEDVRRKIQESTRETPTSIKKGNNNSTVCL